MVQTKAGAAASPYITFLRQMGRLWKEGKATDVLRQLKETQVIDNNVNSNQAVQSDITGDDILPEQVVRKSRTRRVVAGRKKGRAKNKKEGCDDLAEQQIVGEAK